MALERISLNQIPFTYKVITIYWAQWLPQAPRCSVKHNQPPWLIRNYPSWRYDVKVCVMLVPSGRFTVTPCKSSLKVGSSSKKSGWPNISGSANPTRHQETWGWFILQAKAKLTAKLLRQNNNSHRHFPKKSTWAKYGFRLSVRSDWCHFSIRPKSEPARERDPYDRALLGWVHLNTS